MKVVSKYLRIEGEATFYDNSKKIYRILWNHKGFYWKTWSFKNDFYFIVKAKTRRINNA